MHMKSPTEDLDKEVRFRFRHYRTDIREDLVNGNRVHKIEPIITRQSIAPCPCHVPATILHNGSIYHFDMISPQTGDLVYKSMGEQAKYVLVVNLQG